MELLAIQGFKYALVKKAHEDRDGTLCIEVVESAEWLPESFRNGEAHSGTSGGISPELWRSR